MADEVKKTDDLDRPFVPDVEETSAKVEETKVEESNVAVEEKKYPDVTYSRFENVSKARREAEEEAERWRQRALELENRVFSQPKQTEEVPSWWIRLYGDTPEAKDAWRIKEENEPRLSLAEVREEANRAYEERKAEELRSNERNMAILDDNLEALSEVLGRKVTDQEEDELFEIVDEFTPTGEDGKYIGALLPLDKAWEIRELRTRTSTESMRASRNRAVAATSVSSSGQPSSEKVERDKNFNPLNWGQWRERFKGGEE